MISPQLLDSILNYMATKPYREVHSMINAAQQEIAQVHAAQVEEKTEEKGED